MRKRVFFWAIRDGLKLFEDARSFERFERDDPFLASLGKSFWGMQP